MEENDSLVSRTSESKRRIGRAVSINGVNAVEVGLKKSQNLNDPIIDVNLKVNNPIGRLWLAIKRIWKSQNTVIALKFTIPLIVIPIVIYVFWAIWQGRGVRVPMSKLGLIHAVVVSDKEKDILVLPTSDVYMLEYSSSVNEATIVKEKPVVVIGTYKHLDNLLTVEEIFPYNPYDIVPSPVSAGPNRTMWEVVLRFIGQFK